MTTARISTQCCIAGAGPAGIMLGLLLARAGVDVLVLEKHADFLRDLHHTRLPAALRARAANAGSVQVIVELPVTGGGMQGAGA